MRSRSGFLPAPFPDAYGNDTATIGYNPASQITSNTRSNDAYSWTGNGSGSTASIANGLNQLTQNGSAALAYDGRGNLTSEGARTFGYTSENRLANVAGNILAYDPLGRMHYYPFAGAGHIYQGLTLQYDGDELIVEFGGYGAARRYVHGPGVDEPLVWYEGSGTSDRRFLHADERGSVVAVSDSSGNTIGVNKYDEYGVPASTNIGRFQYTGQKWLSEVGLYDYKARVYDPKLGRFLQSDPISYRSGMNLYAYVGGDPINFVDPSGLQEDPNCIDNDDNGLCDPPIVVTGRRLTACERDFRCNFFDLKGLIPLRSLFDFYSPPAPCPGVPDPGAGKATLDANIRQAERDRRLTEMTDRMNRGDGMSFPGLDNTVNFAAKVAPGGRQDYNDLIRGASDYGNFNYGAVGAAHGNSLGSLLDASKIVQGIENGLAGKGFAIKDNSDDPPVITDGFNYYTSGCHN